MVQLLYGRFISNVFLNKRRIVFDEYLDLVET